MKKVGISKIQREIKDVKVVNFQPILGSLWDIGKIEDWKSTIIQGMEDE